jgi:hypothetical protein
MKNKTLTALIGALMLLSACNTQKLDYYKDTTPTASLEKFFDGHIKGWGILQDRSGKVTRRFDVDMHGSWKDGVGTLEEEFVFYDGEKQKRTWTITKMPDGTYQGTAGDILGIAKGKANGSAIQWVYSMDLPVGDTTYRIAFDDWMFQMNDGILVNRSYLKKFGFTVAELTIFMQKQDK